MINLNCFLIRFLKIATVTLSRIHTLPEVHKVLCFLQVTKKTMVYVIASDWELCEIMAANTRRKLQV